MSILDALNENQSPNLIELPNVQSSSSTLTNSNIQSEEKKIIDIPEDKEILIESKSVIYNN